MPEFSFKIYFFALLALLPLYTWSIDFGMRKMLARDQILDRAEHHMMVKRQTGFQSLSGEFCSAGSYLCPASLSGGCCPSGRLCGLTNCPAVSTTGLLSGTSLSSAGVTSSGGSSAAACSAGYSLCPDSVGGGCCLSGYICGTSQCTPPSSSSAASATAGTCGTGSYLCPASLSGGCCPTDRACGLTNCPTFATITSGNAIGTVGTDGTTRFCTTGSSLCPADVNYGCCALGYSCGLTNCVPTSTSTSDCGLGRFSCAASLGGGCCQSGLECGPTNCFVPTTGTFLSTGSVDTTKTGSLASVTTKTSATSTNGAATLVASSSKKSGLSGGAIGGIVGGVIGGLALIALGVLGFCFAKKKKERQAAHTGGAPPMSQGNPPPAPPPAPVGSYYQPAPQPQNTYGSGYNQQPYDNRSSVGPSELGSDVGSGVAKPYGNQFASVPENQINEMPAHGMGATHNFEPIHGQQVYEVDGTGMSR